MRTFDALDPVIGTRLLRLGGLARRDEAERRGGAEILLGVVLLLGTVWLATHAAVLIFAPKSDAPEGGPLG